MLDLRQLRYFVAVAEEEHVGRAAERLHISQSPLSRQIAQLEKNLGLTLFERSQQRIRLTSDGRVFLTEATALLRHASRLENLGRRLGRGEEGGLCVGYVRDAMHTGLLPRALRSLNEEHPGIHVALYDLSAHDQFEGLRQRSLDIALVPQPPPQDDPDLRSTLLLDDPLLLALPSTHPLATTDEVRPEDLDGQPWIAVEDTQQHAWRDDFIAACTTTGFTPDIRYEAPEPLTAAGLVASGLGAALIQRSMLPRHRAGITVHELPWLQRSVHLWAAWHHIDLRPIVTSFRKTVLTTTTEQPDH
ncbi:DNA-binding transcriptional regulator, LysR family [Streptomyces sp. LamerLS-316]|uniref:LysR substrate-binding domain-containing protein n=1 Tax=unclassified Streptomyces TaxID=2593676 RepID=UPI0008237D66|nr:MULTISPECIES: LysR substrate-binding domain-containing protein [unclassified Streptomyces]MYQ39865.1 LysR family transcriptional regulator [Streptomyces sp. SID4921]SCK18966.1 DNA-binding transcriptional regulator, LysR family [Streptomyces sp. LamerLS-316]